MPDTKTGVIPSIYKVDLESFETTRLTPHQKIETIINTFNERDNTRWELRNQNLSAPEIEGYSLELFYGKSSAPAKWLPFLRPIVQTGADILEAENHSASYVLFISNSDEIYAVCGGFGSQAILPYAESNFGLNVLLRIIGKNHDTIKLVRENSLASSTLSRTSFFRGVHSLQDEDMFAKIYKEIGTTLKTSLIYDVFGITKTKPSFVFAKASFLISHRFKIVDLVQLIKKIEEIQLNRELQDFFDVEIIDPRKKKNTILLKQLRDLWNKKLFDTYINQDNDESDICLFPENPETFFGYSQMQILYKGSEVSFEYNSPDNIGGLFEVLKEKNILNMGDIDEFLSDLDHVRIYLDSEFDKGPSQKLSKCLHGEVQTADGQNYFFIDGAWFKVKGTFVERLNNDFESILISPSNSVNLLPWLGGDEGDYLNNYVDQNDDNTMVLHKTFFDNIELCDVLVKNGDELHFLHIKKGFNKDVRVDAQQVELAARRINDCRIQKDYEFLKTPTQSNFQFDSDKLVDWVANSKKIYFHSALGVPERTSGELLNRSSNIAKYALVSVNQYVRSLVRSDYYFEVNLIPTTQD